MTLLEARQILENFNKDPRETPWFSVGIAMSHLLNVAEKAYIVTIIADRELGEAISELRKAFGEMEEE